MDEGGRHRDRRHRAHQKKRRDDDRLAGSAVVDDAIEHARVEAEWRIDVAVSEQHRVVALHHLATKDELGHRETIGRSLTTRRLASPNAVGQSDCRERSQQMARVERQIIRFKDVATRSVERVRHLDESEQVVEIVVGALASLIANPHEGRALSGTEDHRVAPDGKVALRVAGAHRERRRCECGLCEQEVGVEADGIAVNGLAGIAKQLQCMLVIELDSNLLAEPLPASMDRGECVLREWLVAGHQVRQHGSTSLTCNGSCKLALGVDAVKGGDTSEA